MLYTALSLSQYNIQPSLFRKILVKRQTRPRVLIFHFTTSLSYKKFLFQKFWWRHFDDVTSCDLWFGPPNQIFWLQLMALCCVVWNASPKTFLVPVESFKYWCRTFSFISTQLLYGTNCSVWMRHWELNDRPTVTADCRLYSPPHGADVLIR